MNEGDKIYRSRVEQINARERQMRAKSDTELHAVTDELRARLQTGREKSPEEREIRIPIPFRPSRKK
jgi:preprotein translocase subunit SecA